MFAFLTYRLLKRERTRIINLLITFFCSIIIGNTLNMIYFTFEDKALIIWFHLATNFFNFFGIGFLYVANQIIIGSQIIKTTLFYYIVISIFKNYIGIIITVKII